MRIDVGLYGFDVRGPGFFRLHYWGDLLKILRGQIGAEVFVTAVPGCVSLDLSFCLGTKDVETDPLLPTRRTGSVKNRAQVLHKALNETPGLLNRDVNFLAHSMVRFHSSCRESS
jgi:triacylglycerol lipase